MPLMSKDGARGTSLLAPSPWTPRAVGVRAVTKNLSDSLVPRARCLRHAQTGYARAVDSAAPRFQLFAAEAVSCAGVGQPDQSAIDRGKQLRLAARDPIACRR